jgi:tRNA threonylcarbamoyladenosine biosynthesis protein TsaE
VEPPNGTVSTIVTHSEAETADAGRVLGSLACANDVIALSGGLGAGKTCLTQGIARGLGIIEHVPSPTFNLLLVHPGEPTLYHFDLYRLQRASELEDIDLFGTLESEGVSVIEWADRFPGDMPEDRLEIVLDVEGPDDRRLTLVPHGSRAAELVTAFAAAFAARRGERP